MGENEIAVGVDVPAIASHAIAFLAGVVIGVASRANARIRRALVGSLDRRVRREEQVDRRLECPCRRRSRAELLRSMPLVEPFLFQKPRDRLGAHLSGRAVYVLEAFLDLLRRVA